MPRRQKTEILNQITPENRNEIIRKIARWSVKELKAVAHANFADLWPYKARSTLATSAVWLRCPDIHSVDVVDTTGQTLFKMVVLKTVGNDTLSDGTKVSSLGYFSFAHVLNMPRSSSWIALTGLQQPGYFSITRNADESFGPLPLWYFEYVCAPGKSTITGTFPGTQTAPGALLGALTTLVSHLEQNLQVAFPDETIQQSINRGKVLRTLGSTGSPRSRLGTIIYGALMLKVMPTTYPLPPDFWKVIEGLSWSDLAIESTV